MKLEKDIWVVIPAYNEARHIGSLLENTVKKAKNIVVVDDGSKDRTKEIAIASGAIVLEHLVNLGKGAALKTGCDFAVKSGAKRIVVMDADGQHRPEDLPRFVEALKGKDIVFGSRKINKNMPFVFRFGNGAINFVSNMLFHIKLHDTQSGFRAFTVDAYKKIRWNANDYSMESEMIALAGRKRLKYNEIFIDTIYRDRYKGTTVLDGAKIGLRMIWWKITR